MPKYSSTLFQIHDRTEFLIWLKRCRLYGGDSNGDEASAQPLIYLDNDSVALANFSSTLPNNWYFDDLCIEDYGVPFLWCLGRFIVGKASFYEHGSIHGVPRSYASLIFEHSYDYRNHYNGIEEYGEWSGVPKNLLREWDLLEPDSENLPKDHGWEIPEVFHRGWRSLDDVIEEVLRKQDTSLEQQIAKSRETFPADELEY